MTYSPAIATYLTLIDEGYDRTLAALTTAHKHDMSIQTFMLLYFKSISR